MDEASLTHFEWHEMPDTLSQKCIFETLCTASKHKTQAQTLGLLKDPTHHPLWASMLIALCWSIDPMSN